MLQIRVKNFLAEGVVDIAAGAYPKHLMLLKILLLYNFDSLTVGTDDHFSDMVCGD